MLDEKKLQKELDAMSLAQCESFIKKCHSNVTDQQYTRLIAIGHICNAQLFRSIPRYKNTDVNAYIKDVWRMTYNNFCKKVSLYRKHYSVIETFGESFCCKVDNCLQSKDRDLCFAELVDKNKKTELTMKARDTIFNSYKPSKTAKAKKEKSTMAKLRDELISVKAERDSLREDVKQLKKELTEVEERLELVKNAYTDKKGLPKGDLTIFRKSRFDEFLQDALV